MSRSATLASVPWLKDLPRVKNDKEVDNTWEMPETTKIRARMVRADTRR
jgi:hypothetical protein